MAGGALGVDERVNVPPIEHWVEKFYFERLDCCKSLRDGPSTATFLHQLEHREYVSHLHPRRPEALCEGGESPLSLCSCRRSDNAVEQFGDFCLNASELSKVAQLEIFQLLPFRVGRSGR